MASSSPLLSLLLLGALIAGSVYGNGNWNYEENGNDWEGSCETGSRQSPVNIRTADTVQTNNYQPLHFFNYDRQTVFQTTVDPAHYTVKLAPKSSYKLGVGGGGLPGTYILDSLHFHWPSEHTIDSKRGLFEAHIVHFKDTYNSTTEASSDPEGIAVLGVIFKDANDKSKIVDKIQSAAEKNDKLQFALADLLPKERTEFYRYEGSLTTPGCSEAVIWTLFTHQPSAKKDQAIELRGLLPSTGGDTHRNTQPLNGRQLQLWAELENSIFSGSSLPRAWLHIISVISGVPFRWFLRRII